MHSSIRWVRLVCVAIYALVHLTSAGTAQSSLENTLKQFSGDAVKGYLQPMADLFGANMHAGLYRSAHIPVTGFHIAVDIIAMGAPVGDDQKSYDARLPEGYSAATFDAPTIFGDEHGSLYTDPNTGFQYASSGGVINTSLLPLATFQVTAGSVFGTDAIVRFVPIPSISDDKFPQITMWGIGARHSISQYLPAAPLDIAAGVFYSKFSVGDIIDFTGVTVGAQAGKTFSVLSVFGGLAWESSKMNISYTSTIQGVNPNIDIDLDGDNAFRFTLGGSVQLAILRIFADANFGSVTNFSAGLGFGF